ncbi:putative geranylgeranyl transferase type-2 subunit alpha [Diaporthe ampelina]|uniref:Geranylgeranyl transferase type-2 subunit alpha n=1 Tax=Diaporthe ampelina TaxID=1214573 RepID=A0A0G2FEN3_9PEZI|nr:putative geranylgeranyl transferase type-2 subunit alpha [Diaporthe ampelina]
MASHGVTRTNRSRTEEQKLQELDKIAKYRDLEGQVRSQVADANFTPELLKLTSRLLRLNPEYYTIWNVRRRCVAEFFSDRHYHNMFRRILLLFLDHDPAKPRVPDNWEEWAREEARENDLDSLRAELGFTVPLLMEFPKCYWIWNYRSWLLQQAIDRLDPAVARRIWEEELGLDTKMLSKDRRNFHAWGYRRNVVSHLESATLNGKSMAESEFEFTTKMIRVDLSNFSAWHNRKLVLIKEGLNVGPEDQSLWYYHQFLMLDLIEHALRPTITAGFTVEERVDYITADIVDIKDLLEDYDDCKLIYEALIECTLALSTLEKRKPSEGEVLDLETWLSKLQELDPMRRGCWDDMRRQLGLIAQY